MPENLFPKAVLELAQSLEKHEAFWTEYVRNEGPVLGVNQELCDLLCAVRPDRTVFWQSLLQFGWEELIESQDPALLQQAAYAAQQQHRPFLADSFVALADVAEERALALAQPFSVE